MQEPLWAYQKSSSEGAFSDTHYPAAALQVQNWTCTPFILILTSLNLEKMSVLKKHFDPQGYENNLPPQYPYIDETPTDPPSGSYFTYRPTSEEGFSRPMSGQCKFFFWQSL